jgi:hypothetical protein
MNLPLHCLDVREPHRPNIVVVVWPDLWLTLLLWEIVCEQSAAIALGLSFDQLVIDIEAGVFFIEEVEQHGGKEARDTGANNADFETIDLCGGFADVGDGEEMELVGGMCRLGGQHQAGSSWKGECMHTTTLASCCTRPRSSRMKRDAHWARNDRELPLTDVMLRSQSSTGALGPPATEVRSRFCISRSRAQSVRLDMSPAVVKLEAVTSCDGSQRLA